MAQTEERWIQNHRIYSAASMARYRLLDSRYRSYSPQDGAISVTFVRLMAACLREQANAMEEWDRLGIPGPEDDDSDPLEIRALEYANKALEFEAVCSLSLFQSLNMITDSQQKVAYKAHINGYEARPCRENLR